LGHDALELGNGTTLSQLDFEPEVGLPCGLEIATPGAQHTGQLLVLAQQANAHIAYVDPETLGAQMRPR
jgi:hypothetical protein